MKDIITIAVVNFKPFWGEKERNLSRILGYIETQARCGADLIVIPEMALTGYDVEEDIPKTEQMQYRLAEEIPGPSSLAVAELTKQYGIYAVFGMPRFDPASGNYYNSAAICGPDGSVTAYNKIHIPPPEFHWAARGEDPVLLDTPWGPVGIGICYDVYYFPELLRYYKAKGARLIINPTATTKEWVKPRVTIRELEGHAFMDLLYVASANLCGWDKTNWFLGGSCIIGPSTGKFNSEYHVGGGWFSENPADHEPGAFVKTIDLSLVDNTDLYLWRDNPWYGSPDFRPDLYAKWYAELADDSK